MNRTLSRLLSLALWLPAAVAVPACSDDDDDDDTTANDDDTSGACGGIDCGEDEACIDDACVDVARSEIERGCNPLSTGYCMYPWPSDYYAVPDSTAVTGLRVEYREEWLPANLNGDAFPLEEYNDFDGFSANSPIRFLFPEGVDPSNLAPIEDVGLSVDPDSPTVLLNAATGERWEHLPEVDASVTDPARKAVFIRPMRRMDYGTRYIVAVRGLRTPDGTPIEAPAVFRALRDNRPTDLPQVEELRDRYESIFEVLGAAGIERGTLQLAWDFTTVSRDRLTRDMRAMLPDFKARIEEGNLGYTITEVQEDPDDRIKRIVRGTFKVPNYMQGDGGPGTYLNRGEDGLPVFNNLIDAPFVLAIPRPVWEAGAPVPPVVWGHGLFGSGDQVLGIARRAPGFIAAGTDFVGMSTWDVPHVATVFAHHLQGGRAVPERLLQSVVNFSALGYLMTGDLADDPLLTRDGAPLIDPAEAFYMGGSQGGIMGGTVMGIAPNFRRGILVVGGGVYALMVWRSVDWTPYNALWALAQPDTMDREFLMAIFQSNFDFSDPTTYADHLWRDPLPGNPEKRIILNSALGDSEVTNISSEMMARTYGLKMSAPPLYDVYGVPNEAEPTTDSVYVQVDTGHRPLPPRENLPPAQNNGAHGSSSNTQAMIDMYTTFLREGLAVHYCDGPCDPD